MIRKETWIIRRVPSFASTGAGTLVPWNEVCGWAHLPLRLDYLEAAKKWQAKEAGEEPADGAEDNDAEGNRETLRVAGEAAAFPRVRRDLSGSSYISQEEIDAIFAQGRKNQNRKENDRQGYRRYHRGNRRVEAPSAAGSSGKAAVAARAPKERCLLVDGYNVIYAWPELRELLSVNVGSARDRLIREMSDYQGYTGGVLILVFDAYKVKGNPGTVEQADNIFVVYTKEAETADQYIEKTVHQMASAYQVTVATSDGLEQMIIWGDGASRMSSIGLKADLEQYRKQAREAFGMTGEDS